MRREDRIELVKKSLHILLDRLRTDDRVGIVVYGSTGRVLLQPTSIEEREAIVQAITDIRPGGSTNAEEGLLLAYEMARDNHRPGKLNRIILCSDGVANVGRTGPESILTRVRKEADKGIQLTTVGFGMGNYNDVLMEQLANDGDGNYYYVDNLREAKRIFIENLTGTLQTIANDAKIQVEFDGGRIERYRLLGFENRDVADRDFRNDAVDAGEVGAGHEVTALYEIKLADDIHTGTIATVRLRYAIPEHEGDGTPAVQEIEEAFDAANLNESFDSASPRFRLDAAVAEFGEILRHSYWAKESRIADVLPLARRLAEEMVDDPAVEEFKNLLEKATGLRDTRSHDEEED